MFGTVRSSAATKHQIVLELADLPIVPLYSKISAMSGGGWRRSAGTTRLTRGSHHEQRAAVADLVRHFIRTRREIMALNSPRGKLKRWRMRSASSVRTSAASMSRMSAG
jgi:hypothetical protein